MAPEPTYGSKTMNDEIIFRIIFFAVFVLTIGISGFYRKRARESGDVIPRKKEGTLVLTGRLIFAFALLFFIVAYTFFPGRISWSAMELPAWIRWAGVGLAAFCPVLSIWVFRNIGRNISETVLTKQDHELVTSGPYRWIRHPLYSTGILLILSLGLIAGNWVILLGGGFTIIVFRFIVIPKEEKNLIGKFGEQYINYKSATGALFPRL